ncbi:MAG: protein kinase [Myxococcaceae bacterium]
MSAYVCKTCGAEYPAWVGPCVACGSNEHVELVGPEDRSGQTISGRYRLIRRLGEGGMGAVYLAEQLGVGNQLALKFLKPEFSKNPALTKRFLNEARIYIRVAHPGAVQLNDYGQDETGALYLVMELVDGVDLKRLLDQRRRLEPKEAVQIVLAVADVLAHAHSKGVVHRDLKPENVMVRPSLSGFHVKVLDFGIAHLAYEGAERLTQTGAMAGTPKYMSPEQVRGESIDARTDVYALGLVLFELLTGRAAFEGASVSEILAAQASQPVPALQSVDARLVHPGLDLIVSKATQKRPGDRYQTMVELAQALGALTDDQLKPGAEPLPPPVDPGTGPTLVSTRREQATPAASLSMPAPVALKPVTAPPVQPASSKPLVMALLTLLLAAAAGVWLVRKAPPDPMPAATCPQLAIYDMKWRSLSVAELEQQVLHLPYLRPSDAKKQLATLKSYSEAYAPEQRECFYKASLIASASNVDAVLKSSPALWGLRVASETLRQQFLELPLKQEWTLAQRKDVLEQIDTNVLPHLETPSPEDGEYWRRMYYGTELTCEATDAALEQLRAQRPTNCLHFQPH